MIFGVYSMAVTLDITITKENSQNLYNHYIQQQFEHYDIKQYISF